MMNIPRHCFGFRQKLLVVSLFAAFGPAHAADDEMAQFIKPDSSIGVGIGVIGGDDKDRTIFGQYNGLRKNDASLLLDFDIVKRDDATGLWTNAEGRNIGLDNREIRFSQQRQGDWKYSAEFSELVRRDLRTINTNLQNAGTTAPVVTSLATPATGADVNLNLKRKALTLGAEKWLSSNLLFEASFKNEEKDGARLFGIGNSCSNVIGSLSNTCASATGGAAVTGALLLLPEPINSSTRQLEAKLSYSGETFTLSGGYYGSFFSNSNGALNPFVNGNLVNPDGTVLNTAIAPGSTLAGLGGYLQQTVALAPDNEAHQLYVSGTYALTPKVRANFKMAKTRAKQDDSFVGTGLAGAPAGVDSLGGRVDTTLLQVGLSGRPSTALPKLSMVANFRYEDRDDKTQLAAYTVDGAVSRTNTQDSLRRVTSKLEASYALPDNYRATVGVDYAEVDRRRPVASAIIPAASFTAWREQTEEIGYRAEVRRSLSETLNAAVGYGHSKREGDRWLRLVPGYPPASDAAIAGSPSALGTLPMTMMDRRRDKLKVSADWAPTSTLSVQFIFEDGKDEYSGPTQKGLHDTGMKFYGVDAAFALSDAWKLTGYVNQAEQILHVDHGTGYVAALDNDTVSVGIGVTGKLSNKLEVGADVSYTNDRNRYNLSMSTGAAIVGGLPDVTYRVSSLKLFGKYAMAKNGDIRVDLVHQSAQFDEWTWAASGVPFAYSDNTTVSMQPNQSVTFLGARYIYKFR